MSTFRLKSLLPALLLAAALPAFAEEPPQAEPEQKAAPRRTFQLEGHALVLPSPMTFAAGSDELKPESTPALEHVKAYLEDKGYISLLRIEGHVAEDTAEGMALSAKRALAVGRWLVAHGVDCKRLLAVGFGGTKPVADPSTPEGRAQNTRVAFINAALRGRAIGGMPVEGGGQVAGELCTTSGQ
jgi:OOP family OmpA-OmpF porin